MRANYLKIAIRHLRRNPLFSALNIAGLPLGLACFALIGLHVVDELSFDQFHVKHERIFRVLSTRAAGFRGEPAQKEAFMPMPLGPALQAEFGDVEALVRFRPWGAFTQSPTGIYEEEGLCFVDADFFKVFSFDVLKGDATTALKETQSVVLTEKTALRLFGYTDAVGQTVLLKVFDAFEPFVVTAIVADPMSNSSLRFGMLLPFERYKASPRGAGEIDRWSRVSFQTYVLLREGSTLNKKPEQLQQFYTRHHPNDEANARQKGWWTAAESPFGYALQPLSEMRHDTSVNITTVDAKHFWLLLGIGILVLFIACANFTTLAIGRSMGRAMEASVRKTMGASRWQVAKQHLFEAFLMSFLATSVAGGLAYVALPMFNTLIGKELVFSFNQFPALYWLFPSTALVTGLLAGAYPALVLSGFRPMDVFRKKIRLGGENYFTRSLITAQFTLSIGLAICMLVIVQQLHFLRTSDPGFQKENVVIVNAFGTENADRTILVFQQNLQKVPEVQSFSRAEMSLGAETGESVSGFEYKGKSKEIYEYVVDVDYIPTLGLTLLAGRNFETAMVADTQTSIVINEAAMHSFGWTLADVIGQKLSGYTENPSSDPVVIGVVKDYHFHSLHSAVQPMMLQMFSPYPRAMLFVRLQKGYPETALANIQAAWVASEAKLPFRYQFLDESIDKFYKTEQRWSQVVTIAGGLAMFLACLGLFGLAVLAAANRTKEIGIRKVLGASIAGIIGLLAKDFLKLVLIAIVIASPIAYYFMNKWLADFAYRIEIQWWMFAAAGIAALAIAFLTVGGQAVKAALANPVQSLRSE
jgi:putative ABC transport system permease protein